MILFVTQTFLPETGGAHNFMTGLVRALTVRGHPAEVYCRTSRLDAVKKFDASRRYPIHRFGGLTFWRQWQINKAVAKRIARGGVTTVVTDTWKNLEGLPSSALKSVHVVCLAHGNEYLGNASRKQRIGQSLARAQVVVANSKFTADLVGPFAGKTPVETVLPGISPPHGANTAPAKRAAEDRLLCVARLEARKGIDQVIGALAALQPQYPNLMLDIVGHGDDAARLAELAESLGVSRKVRFHGYVSDTARSELIRKARVFVLPNRLDPNGVDSFGANFLEAAAYGVPAIAGKEGASREAVLDGETGLVVNGDDIDALTGALRQLLEDDALCHRLGEAAQKRFWSEFVWSEAVTRFETVLGLKGEVKA